MRYGIEHSQDVFADKKRLVFALKLSDSLNIDNCRVSYFCSFLKGAETSLIWDKSVDIFMSGILLKMHHLDLCFIFIKEKNKSLMCT